MIRGFFKKFNRSSKNMQNVIFHVKLWSLQDLKATSHLTIFDIPIRTVREDQRHRRGFYPLKKAVIIYLNFVRCTLPTDRNH